MSSHTYHEALGLDLGAVKIGVARINSVAKIPEPLGVLKNDDTLLSELKKLVDSYRVDLLVFGLPRNLKGEKTEQSLALEALARNIASELGLLYLLQDETLSSVRAQEYAQKSGSGASEDAIAACIILEDFANLVE